jgi:serine phosphatase RsbU (regulator of sigma subunit)/anti-sigma regulatory factor (Ser/Thr protein kinase)
MAREPFRRHYLSLDSSPASSGEASVWARTLAAQAGLPGELASELDLCIIELVNNVVDHAYSSIPGEIEIELDLNHSEAVFTVMDSGPAFNPLDLPPPKKARTLEEAPVGGLGVHLVRETATACRYERRAGRNRLSAYFGEGDGFPRFDERRETESTAFPLMRADGTVIESDERSGTDRRMLGFISQCSMFHDVPYADLEAIVARCTIRSVGKDEVILEPGAASHSVLVPVTGSLRVRLGGVESEEEVVIPRGDCVGEISVADGKPISAHVVAAEDLQLLVIDDRVFLDELLAVPQVGRNMISLLAERMRRTNERVIERVRAAAKLQALQRELDFASRIQLSMLPPAPLLAGAHDVQCAGFMRAARQVGGDYYDAHSLGNNRHFLAIGDVCGKGMPAALFMVQSLTILRTEISTRRADPGAHLARWVKRTNEQLAAANDAQLFVTLCCLVIDTEAGKLHCVNAGHCAPVMWTADKAPHFLEAPRNPVVGMIPELSFRATTIDFPAGAGVLLYTDGVTEAESPKGEQFGDDALLWAAGKIAKNPLPVLDPIVRAVDAFAADQPQSDDITMLLVRRTEDK